jgi:hypothetical protein
MKKQLVSPETPISRRTVHRGTPILLASLALAVLCTTSQAFAQSLFGRDTAASAPTATASKAVPAAPSATTLSAPVPNIEEANLAKPAAGSLFDLAAAQDGQSSSQSQALTDPIESAPKPAATKTKPAHHGLGIAMATVGTVALVAGVGAFALSEECKNPTKGTCGSIHSGGIGLMAGGGAVAATGFYFQFHR